MMYAAVDLALEESRAFEHLEMLGDRRLRDRKLRRDLADGEPSAGEPLHDPPPCGVRERREDGIEA